MVRNVGDPDPYGSALKWPPEIQICIRDGIPDPDPAAIKSQQK